MPFDQQYEFRSKLLNALNADLMGPGSDEEVLSDPPITRYIVGILYPQSPASIDASQDLDPSEEDEETGRLDPPIAMANIRYPSSIGMTFAVDPQSATAIKVTIEAARYRPVESDDSKQRRRRFTRRTLEGPAEDWRREPVGPNSLTIDVTMPVHGKRVQVAEGLELYSRVRPSDARGVIPVTLVLLNAQSSAPGEFRDEHAFFQPKISVTAPTSDEAFVERQDEIPVTGDEDLTAHRLLYRHARSFAIGHGCSVEWNVSPKDPNKASAIRTTFAPSYELHLSDSNPAIRHQCLGMQFLGSAPKAGVLADLGRLCSGYETWIAKMRTTAQKLPKDLSETAAGQLRWCEESLARMRGGIRLLDEEPYAWDAFRLMNRAMLQQRARTEWLQAGGSGVGPVESSQHQWRPFQLAFILLCLEGLLRQDSPDRRLVDLLWFPTGGGKTEAYLGLIAFTVFLRRLRSSGSADGVTALMRYTLRLLTIQQFQRATLLICCCEAIRRSEPRLGPTPIAVGLWIGQDGTPNTRREARISLNKLRDGAVLHTRNPMQLQSCPWCGTRFDHKNYYLTNTIDRLVIDCRNNRCSFAGGIPVYVVDEDIYDYQPTLLIATVDKFASIPWREEVSHLFNLPGSKTAAPELIIQDELHLISGPLGTLTGLYETAVDFLCTRDGVGPKVIASTATIRRAGRQTLGLFDREVRQFPPAGIDARDSYFAVETDRNTRGTRLYVGLMAPGTSQTTLLIRTYAGLLQKAAEMSAPAEVKDPYWTLVGYFNSLRVLGGARMAVQDDVTDRMELLAREARTTQRAIDNRIELTSREPSANIPDYLRRMSIQHPDPDALDIIIATNMISVGVDINRLGLMVVMGQPPSTSEYIQSTSRVGRRYPGLVIVLFNAAKSRDRSHYESFVTYHSAIYRQVESTSVTPFSSRSRDRGLHAVLIGLARHLIPTLRQNEGAAAVEGLIREIMAIRNMILTRVAHVAPDEHAAAAAELDEVIEKWRKAVRSRPGLVFRSETHPENALLVDISRGDVDDGNAFPTLWSLRDVDRSSGLYPVK